MADLVTEILNKGTYNRVNYENIPQEAASDAQGWISTDDAIELSRGRILHGLERNYSANQKQTLQNKALAFGQEDEPGKIVKVAQKFRTKDKEGELIVQDIDGVLLYKKNDTGQSDNFSIKVSIQKDSGDTPDGTTLASKTFSSTEWKNIPQGIFKVILSASIELERESDYWIIIENENTDNSNYPNIGYYDLNNYSEGKIKTFATPTGWDDLTGDLMFYILEESLVEGGITGHHVAYKVDGSPVFFRKAGSAIQYFDENAGIYIDIFNTYVNNSGNNVLINPNQPISVADHTSLAGNSVYFGGLNGLWKVSVASPQNYADVYDEAKNFKGFILIDRSRMILWGREDDQTGLYGSKIDPQDGTVYTTVIAEAGGASGQKEYTGTLTFKAGSSKRTCFGVVVKANYIDSEGNTKSEEFKDDFSGNLTSEQGGTGFIDYMTGIWGVTFANTTSGAVTIDYQWEDPTDGGVADFSKSVPRVAGEGFIFRQDKGGDKIMYVFIQEGKYISLKERSSYELTLGDDDSTASNIPFRDDIGLPYWRAGIASINGVIFMNTANPDRPVLTTLQRISTASILEPVNIADHFDFSKYKWDKCWMETYNEYIIFSGRTPNSDSNNRIFLFNPRLNSVDVLSYDSNTFVKALGELYIGSSVNHSISKVLNGFDDDGSIIENYWESRNELFETTNLKKIRRLRFGGMLSKEQNIKVSISYDGDKFEEVGNIRGDEKYVDRSTSYAIGTAGIGTATVGGNNSDVASPFLVEIKLKRAPKFRGRRIKFEATGIGFASINKITDFDILEYNNRLPAKYRMKQNVSLDGKSQDL